MIISQVTPAINPSSVPTIPCRIGEMLNRQGREKDERHEKLLPLLPRRILLRRLAMRLQDYRFAQIGVHRVDAL
jgi:hypothetical protein